MIWLALLAVLAAAGVIVCDRLRLRRTMDTMDKMLDDAIRGTFTPTHFDESRLSAVEAKLKQYLDSSGTSAARLAEDRARVQGLRGHFAPDQNTDCKPFALRRATGGQRLAR